MATRIIEEIPELGGGPGPFQSLRMGTESATLRSLLWIVDPDHARPAITEEALAGDREFVRRGVSLDRVLRWVRLGHAGMARAYMAACEQLLPAEDRAETMQQVSERLFDYIDEFAGSMATEFITERDRWVTSAAAAREETVRAVLDTDGADPTAAGPALDYDLSRDHVGLLLWFDPIRPQSDTAELQRAALDILRHWGCTQTLVVPVGSAQLWAWGSRVTLPDRLQVTDHRPDHSDVRLAHGAPGAGITGFRRSHREALAAERVHRLQGAPGRWATSFADVEIAALVTADLPAAATFVQRTLGPLSAGAAGDLRVTLLAYLQQGNSPHLAAQQLHVSRNTVNYRVKRISELLGENWRDRQHQLHTALLVLQATGDALLLASHAQPDWSLPPPDRLG